MTEYLELTGGLIFRSGDIVINYRPRHGAPPYREWLPVDKHYSHFIGKRVGEWLQYNSDEVTHRAARPVPPLPQWIGSWDRLPTAADLPIVYWYSTMKPELLHELPVASPTAYPYVWHHWDAPPPLPLKPQPMIDAEAYHAWQGTTAHDYKTAEIAWMAAIAWERARVAKGVT